MVKFVGDDELIAVMDGALPPEDFTQASAYFEIAYRRLAAAHGEEWERDAHLLAGAAPDLLWNHWLRKETTRVTAQRAEARS
jgi:hypothetical protein